MIGRTLSHYRIVGQLGSGGMGVVYCAEDDRLGRQVALKFVSSDLAHDEQALQRLRSEARAASALNHPNICTIYDIGEDDGHPFIVMELMKGQNLRDRLNNGALKVSQLVDIGVEVSDALHTAHAAGIIHRDIKPGNIFITERGHVKLLDFGLAKLTATLTSTTTADLPPHTSATGVTHGTPAYMSPEQATGETLDGRTDLFSLGVVMYECATGHHPFPGKTSAVVLAGILDRSPASPLSHNPDLPLRLSEIISNCLEKDRELRYQSAADLRADLKRFRRDLDSGAIRPVERSSLERAIVSPQSASVTAAIHARGQTAAVDAVTRDASNAQSTSRTALWPAIAGVAALIAAIALVVALWPRGDTPPAADIAQTPTTVTAPPAAPAPTPTPSPASPSTEPQMTAARASFQAGNYRAALASAREVLAIESGNLEAVRIRDEATAMLARFDDAVAETRRRLAANDPEGAARALERARTVDVSSPTVFELASRIGEARARSTRAPVVAAAPPPAPAAPITQIPIPPIPTPPPVTALPSPPAPTEPGTTLKQPEPPARPAPPSTPAKEAEPPSENIEAAIRQVIATYGRAIEGKDLNLFRSIKPSLTPQEERRLQDGFRAVTSQRVSLSIISIEHKGDNASAVVRRRDDIEAGGRKQTTETRQVLAFARTPTGWVITEIRSETK